MYTWISNVIKAITEFFSEFSKLNNVKDHSIIIFWKILAGIIIALFFCKLFLREDLYDWVVSLCTNATPISFAVVVGIAMMLNSIYAQKRVMHAVVQAVADVKKEEKQKDKECYAQTSRIEKEANALTDRLLDVLNCDVVTVELLHNTEKYVGGFHKRFYDECYPAINTAHGIKFNCTEFQNIPTNLFPIINHMEENKFQWFSSMDEVAKIDPGYAQILKDHDCIGLGMRYMRTIEGEDLGILTVTWRKGNEQFIPKQSIIQECMTETAAKLETLLDMSDYE